MSVRSVALIGLCGGLGCLLAAGGIYYWAANLHRLPGTGDMRLDDGHIQAETAAPAGLPRAGTVAWPSHAKRVALAAFIVLGTVLVSVGTVALLDLIGVLGAPAPELRRGGSAAARSDVPAQPDHGTGPTSAGSPEIGEPSRGAAPADLADAPTAPAPSSGAGADRARAAGRGPEEAAGPEPRTPTIEPLPPEPPQPGDLIAAWDDYRLNGDGHFSRRGLQQVLDQRRLEADVSGGERVGAGDALLIVETSGTPNFYVLPSFNKSPRAVAAWFDDHGSGALTGRTQRVTRVAQGRWLDPGRESGKQPFEMIEKGEIE